MGYNRGFRADLWQFCKYQIMSLKKGQYFIVATGTDSGKTFLLTKICKKLRAKNISCDAIKPIASGFKYDDPQSDSAKILQSLGEEFSIKNVENITPWRFNAALAPSIAAVIENSEINFSELQNFCGERILWAQNGRVSGSAANVKKPVEYFLIEGAGGVMTPISSDKTFLDLIVATKIPVLLLGQNYLGAMSHTLCAVEALRAKSVAIDKIIINDHPKSEIKISDTIAEITRFSCIETVAIDDFLSKF